MEELLELKAYVEQGNYAEALTLIGEMEEMSKDDKISKIESFMEILLIHLIKQHAEKRTTRSWEVSIRNAVRKILFINKRRKSGGYYLSEEELWSVIHEAWDSALLRASLEAFEGRYDEIELAQKLDIDQVKYEAMQLIQQQKAH